MDNLDLWNKVKLPPDDAMKTIGGGRLKGFTDINPQWRLKVLTEHFGPCGEGWKYSIDKLWTEQGATDQIVVFALISLFCKQGQTWGEPIPGIGGSFLVEKEKTGPHTSDEAYKMAVTDALGVACKALGIAADVYGGKVGKAGSGSKYSGGGATTGSSSGTAAMPPCPKCKKTNVMKSKFDSADYYCHDCKQGWLEEKKKSTSTEPPNSAASAQLIDAIKGASDGNLTPPEVLEYVQAKQPSVASLLDLNTGGWGSVLALVKDGTILKWLADKNANMP